MYCVLSLACIMPVIVMHSCSIVFLIHIIGLSICLSFSGSRYLFLLFFRHLAFVLQVCLLVSNICCCLLLCGVKILVPDNISIQRISSSKWLLKAPWLLQKLRYCSRYFTSIPHAACYFRYLMPAQDVPYFMLLF